MSASTLASRQGTFQIPKMNLVLNSNHIPNSCICTRYHSSNIAANANANKAGKVWKVYLSGEIHSDWREVIAQGIHEQKLPVSLTSPNTSHEDSDDCAAIILGMEEKRQNWDAIGARMNAVRTQTLIQEADVVVVRFGEKYRQWNAGECVSYL